jgi:hypothetical protein
MLLNVSLCIKPVMLDILHLSMFCYYFPNHLAKNKCQIS